MLQQHSSGLARMTVNQRIPCTDKNITRAPAGTAGAFLICLGGLHRCRHSSAGFLFACFAAFPWNPKHNASGFWKPPRPAACPRGSDSHRGKSRGSSACVTSVAFSGDPLPRSRGRSRVPPRRRPSSAAASARTRFPVWAGLSSVCRMLPFLWEGARFIRFRRPPAPRRFAAVYFRPVFRRPEERTRAILRLSAQRPAAMIRHSQRQGRRAFIYLKI